MNIFIDTNILLSFFHFTQDDLEELNKLNVLLKQREHSLWLPEQVRIEFERNRENKIADTLKRLKDYKSDLQFPSLCKDYSEYDKLRGYQKEFQKEYENLINHISEDIREKNLKADLIINSLFAQATPIETSESILQAARNRRDIGNPPGKNNSLGDSINWESLLAEVSDNEEIYFITDDKDYYSVIDDKSGKTFLLDEWKMMKRSDINFYRNIASFFNDHFPAIKLSTELEKQLQIQELQNSLSFAHTHSIIAKLKCHDNFSSSQVKDIICAAITNDQIKWILDDPDVEGFYKKIISGYSCEIDPRTIEFFESKWAQNEPELISHQ